MKSRSVLAGELFLEDLFLDNLDRLYLKDIKIIKKILKDPKKFFELVIKTKDSFVKWRNHIIGLYENSSVEYFKQLNKYSFALVNLFQEQALPAPLVVENLRILRKIAENETLSLETRRQANKSIERLFRRILVDLRGKKEKVNIFTLKKDYDEEFKRHKDLQRFRSEANKRLHLKKWYPAFDESQINKIYDMIFPRERVLKVLQYKYYKSPNTIKDMLAKANNLSKMFRKNIVIKSQKIKNKGVLETVLL